jgi:protein SCO1/2
MISECLNRYRFLLSLFLLVLSPVGVHPHVPGARDVAPITTGLNTKVPDFVLLNQDGKSFDSATLRGKVVVVNFIFTTCTDVCPLFTAHFAQLQRALKNGPAGDLYFVSITTDPEVDSPKVLKSYAQRYGVDFQNWAFLTGTEAQMKQVWKGFGVRVVHKGRGLVQHTSLTTVIDREGVRRFNYFGEKWQLKDLQQDIAALLAKKHNH